MVEYLWSLRKRRGKHHGLHDSSFIENIRCLFNPTIRKIRTKIDLITKSFTLTLYIYNVLWLQVLLPEKFLLSNEFT